MSVVYVTPREYQKSKLDEERKNVEDELVVAHTLFNCKRQFFHILIIICNREVYAIITISLAHKAYTIW